MIYLMRQKDFGKALKAWEKIGGESFFLEPHKPPILRLDFRGFSFYIHGNFDNTTEMNIYRLDTCLELDVEGIEKTEDLIVAVLKHMGLPLEALAFEVEFNLD